MLTLFGFFRAVGSLSGIRHRDEGVILRTEQFGAVSVAAVDARLLSDELRLRV